MSTTANHKNVTGHGDTIDTFIWKTLSNESSETRLEESDNSSGESQGFLCFPNIFWDDQILPDPANNSVTSSSSLTDETRGSAGLHGLIDGRTGQSIRSLAPSGDDTQDDGQSDTGWVYPTSVVRANTLFTEGSGFVDVKRDLQSWQDFGWLHSGNGGDIWNFQASRSADDSNLSVLDGGSLSTALSSTFLAAAASEITISFQQNVGGYVGTIDTFLRESRPGNSYDTKPYIDVDGADKRGGEIQGLLQFSDIFGDGPGQIPLGATITSATLSLTVSNGTRNPVSFYMMADDWTIRQDLSWNGFTDGIQTDGIEAYTTPDVVLSRISKGTEIIDVTNSLQSWSDQTALNRGWLLSDAGDNGFRFQSSESSGAPILSVTYTIPTDPVPGMTVTQSDGSTVVTEGGAGDGISIVLDYAPTSDVTITITTTGLDDINYAPQQLTFTAANWQTAQTVTLSAIDDALTEGTESFSLSLTATSLDTAYDGMHTNVGVSVIDNDATQLPLSPAVIAIHDTTQYSAGDPSGYGSGDPSGIAYVPELDLLFIADSEHNESPYYSPVNLFATRLDGTFVASFSLQSYSDEPTGVAYNPFNGLLYISDDDARRIFITDPNDPTTLIGSIDVGALGIRDAEDPVIDPVTGHIYLLNGSSRQLVELSETGDLIETITLPDAITDAEGLAYDAAHDVFYVASGSTRGTIFEIDRDGSILDQTDLLNDYRSPITGGKPKLKGLEIAPSSDPDDGDKMSLYAVDYGHDQVPDGRLFEIDLHHDWLIA